MKKELENLKTKHSFKIKFFARTVLYSFAFVSIVLLAGFLFLQTDSARKTLLTYICNEIGTQINGTFTAEQLDGDLLFTATLIKPTLKYKNENIFEADEISVLYFSPMLLNKKLLISSIDIKSPIVNGTADEKGVWNFEKLIKTKAIKKEDEQIDIEGDDNGIEVILDSVTITKGEVTIKNPDTIIRADSVEFSSVLDLKKKTIEVNRFSFDLSTPAIETRLNAFSCTLALGNGGKNLLLNNGMILTRKSFANFDGSINLEGDFDFFNNKSTRKKGSANLFDFNIDAKKIVLAEIDKTLKLDYQLDDIVSGEITISGKPGFVYFDLNGFIENPDKASSLLPNLTSIGRLSFVKNQNNDNDLNVNCHGIVKNITPEVVGRFVEYDEASFMDTKVDLNYALGLSGLLATNGPDVDLGIDSPLFHVMGREIKDAKGEVHYRAGKLSINAEAHDRILGLSTLFANASGLNNSEKIKPFYLNASTKGTGLSALQLNDSVNSKTIDKAGDNSAEEQAGVLADNLCFKVESSGTIPGDFDYQGIKADVSLLLDKKETNLFSGFEVFDLKINSNWDRGRLIVNDLLVDTDVGNITAHGTLAPATRTQEVNDIELKGITAHASVHNLSKLITSLNTNLGLEIPGTFKGKATADLKASGTLKEIKAAYTAKGSGLAWDEYNGDKAEVKGTVSLIFDNRDYTTDVDYKIKWDGTLHKVAYIEDGAEGFDISKLNVKGGLAPDRIDLDITGIRTGDQSAWLKGTIHDWQHRTMNIEVDRAAIKWNGELLENDSQILFVFKQEEKENQISVNTCKFVSKGAVLSMGGRLSIGNDNSSQNIDLTIANLNFDKFKKITGSTLTGTANVNLNIAGTGAAPEITGNAFISNGESLDFKFSKANATLKYKDSRVEFAGVLEKIVDIKKAGVLRKSRINNKTKVSSKPKKNKKSNVLKKTGKIVAKEVFSTIGGIVDVGERIIAGGKDKAGISRKKENIDRPGELSVADFHEKKILDVAGTAHVKFSLIPFVLEFDKAEVDATVMAEDLVLSDLPIPKIDGFEFDGLIDLDAKIIGKLLMPDLSGHVSVESGFLKIKNPRLSFEEIRGSVDFSPDSFKINNLELAGDRVGQILITGECGLNNFNITDYDLKFTGDNVSMPFSKATHIRFKPDITISGTHDMPMLMGKIEVLEGKVNLDILNDREPEEIKIINNNDDDNNIVVISDENESKPDFYKKLYGDIKVSIPKNFWLKGTDENIEIAGDINIKKEHTASSFVVYGDLEAVRGSYKFQGRKFTLKQGRVSFMGLKEPDPALDITVTTRISRVEIIILITGSLRDFFLTLDSVPQMDRTDIISYILFSKPASSLESDQAFEAGKAALSFTGKLAAEELNSILSEKFGIDSISIESGGGDITRGTLSIGKYIAPDVFVTYRQGFHEDNLYQFEITYEISKNLSLEAEIGDEKTSGVDLMFEYDF